MFETGIKIVIPLLVVVLIYQVLCVVVLCTVPMDLQNNAFDHYRDPMDCQIIQLLQTSVYKSEK